MSTPYFLPPDHWRGDDIKMLLMTACIIAVVDGLAAVAVTYFLHDRSPIIVFQYIASGLIGGEAFTGGLSTAFIGVLCHFFIAAVWTLLFFIFHRPVSHLLTGKISKAVVYGILIWAGMNMIVLPLSHVSMGPRDLLQTFVGIAVLIFAAGLPIAYRFDQYYAKRSS
jgi:hypothetical protein